MEIICLGDSLTQGYGVMKNECWVWLLGENTRHTWLNRGVSGQTSGEIKKRLYHDVIARKPDEVIITCGVNDFIFQVNDEEIAFSNVKKMAEAVMESQIKPILGIPLPVIKEIASVCWFDGTDYDRVNERIVRYRDFLLDYSKENALHYIDFYDVFQASLRDLPAHILYSDGLHPTPFGHKLMYETVKEYIHGV